MRRGGELRRKKNTLSFRNTNIAPPRRWLEMKRDNTSLDEMNYLRRWTALAGAAYNLSKVRRYGIFLTQIPVCIGHVFSLDLLHYGFTGNRSLYLVFSSTRDRQSWFYRNVLACFYLLWWILLLIELWIPTYVDTTLYLNLRLIFGVHTMYGLLYKAWALYISFTSKNVTLCESFQPPNHGFRWLKVLGLTKTLNPHRSVEVEATKLSCYSRWVGMQPLPSSLNTFC